MSKERFDTSKPHINIGTTGQEKPQYKTCPNCHGMGVKEKADGDTFDCPSVQCNNGLIKIN